MTLTSEYVERNDGTPSGMVFKKSTGKYFVRTVNGVVECSISSTLRKHFIYPTADPASIPRRVVEVADIRAVDPVAIGDEVSFVEAGESIGMITDIHPRRNKFSRKAFGTKPLEQVIASNVDQIVGVFATRKPKLRWDMLDRYIAGSESLEIPILICINKMDLADEDETRGKLLMYEEMGYPVVFTSAVTGAGIEEFKESLKGRVSVLVGESAVGKSSLLNIIQPGLELRVNELSKGKKGKGKHTTTALEMFDFDFGGSVVDTPGMREFGLWNIRELDVAYLYREMRPYLGQCRFGADCSHTHEPGCAVKDAVEGGEIAEPRYKSYVRLIK